MKAYKAAQLQDMAKRGWQTFELRLVCDVKGERLVLLQQVLRELEGEIGRAHV